MDSFKPTFGHYEAIEKVADKFEGADESVRNHTALYQSVKEEN